MGRKRQRQVDDDDNGEAVKRPRPYSEKDAKLAKIYARLSDEVSEKRSQATKELLQELGPGSGVSAEDLQKALRKLIKGICSGRKAARLGFFVALAELLHNVFGAETKYTSEQVPDLKELVNNVESITTPEGEAVGQERKDFLLGRLFTWKAFMSSGIPDPDREANLWNEVIHNVLVLFLQVTWLRDECALVLIDVLRNPSSDEKRDSTQALTILNGLLEKGLTKTPEGVAVWLVARQSVPEAEYPKKVWHKGDPLHQKERQALVAVFKQTGSETKLNESEENGPRKGGHWQPNPSLPWMTLAQALWVRAQRLSTEESEAGAVEFFSKAWRDMIDNILFSQKASPERKFWGFRLFSDMISAVLPYLLKHLFSPNLVNVLANQLKDNERFLHEAALNTLRKIKTRAEKDPSSCTPLFNGLLAHDMRLFSSDKDKKIVKLAHDIIAAMSEIELDDVVDDIQSAIEKPTSKPEESNIPLLRQTMADLLVDLVRGRTKQSSGASKQESESIKRAISHLSQLTYYTKPGLLGEASPKIDASTRQMLQPRLYSILTALCTIDLERAVQYTYYTIPVGVQESREGSTDPEFLAETFVLEADQRVWKQLARSHGVLHKLAKSLSKKSANVQVLTALQLLFYLTILEVHNGDADAVSLLEELELCYESVKSQKKADEKAFDLIIELLLGFLSKSSSLYKKMAELVFTACASGLSQDSLQSMLHILEQQEDLAGQQELFDANDSVDGDDDDVEEVDSEDDDEDEDASDVEMIDGDDANGLKTDLEADEQSDNDEEDDDEDEDDEESEADDDSGDEEIANFNKMLAQTLRTSNPLTDGKGKEDDSSDDEADMDDDAMEALDPHLTKIFQQRRAKDGSNKRKEQKGAKENMTNFKNRVLDLLSILTKKQSTNPITLEILPVLLKLIRTTKAKHLATKAHDILSTYIQTCSRTKEYPKISDTQTAWAVLRSIHDEAKQSSTPAHGSASSRASLFVLKALVLEDAENFDQGADLYAKTLKDWNEDKKGSGLKPSFFTEWVAWCFDRKKGR